MTFAFFTLIKPSKNNKTNPGNSGFPKKNRQNCKWKTSASIKIPKKKSQWFGTSKVGDHFHPILDANGTTPQSRKAFLILFCIHCQQASIFFKLAQTRSTLLFDQFYVLFWNEALNKVSLLVSEVAFILATLGFKWNHPCLTDKCPEKSRASSKTALFNWGNRQQVARCKQKGTID